MFTFNGKKIIIPGAYGIIRVIQLAGATLPDFQVGLIIAKSMKGAPYTCSSKGSEVMLGYSDANALAKDYGYDDLYTIFAKAKSKGAGAMFVINAQPNSQASVVLLTTSMTISAAEKNYGVFGNDIKFAITEGASDTLGSHGGLKTGTATAGTGTTLTDSGAGWTISELVDAWIRITAGTGMGQTRKISANTATEVTVATWDTTPDTSSTYEIIEAKFTVAVTPTKNEHMLSADGVDTAFHIYVNSIDGLAAGQTVDLINETDGKEGSHEIASIDTTYNTSSSGYKVVLKTAVSGSNCTKALYARIMQSDTEKKVTQDFVGDDWNLENIILTLNDTPAFREQIICSGGSNTPDVVAEEYLGELASAVKGTNPTISENDYVNIAGYYTNWVSNFIKVNKVNIRVICLASTNATTHATYKSLATTMRGQTYRKPIHVLASPPKSTAKADLVTKGQNVNSDELTLCAQGIDDQPDYLTFLPQVFGLKMYNAVNHNLTRDLIDASKLANDWTVDEQELLIKNGIMTCVDTKTGVRLLKGINTYQYHDHEWNEADEMTYLQYFRDIADYIYVGVIEEIDARLTGTDKVTLDKANACVNAICKTFEESDFVDEVSPRGLTKVEEGYDVKIDIKIPGITDYFGITVNVLAGYTG